MKGDLPGSPIRWRMHIPARPERVYTALDSERAAFWAESAEELDSQITFVFITGERVSARIIERKPPTIWSIEYFGSPVRFELASSDRGGTDLLLVHEGVAPDEWNEVHAGWLNVLFPLKAWVAHGIDLRNHDPRRTWDEGFADQ